MCRLAAYLGKDVLIENVLVKPANSLLKQSMNARESDYPTNGDGFGLGWYAPQISAEPGLFTSTSPAWSDRNLLSLASKIVSPCFFGHIRSATLGGVTQFNCHPFVHGKWMFMHNGGINEFTQVKRHLRHLLEDDIYNWIKGETDSEHLFALFLQMARGRNLIEFDAIAKLVHDVFRELHRLEDQFGSKGPSFLNICITDGKRILATRYCSDRRFRPESLHYAIGNRYALINDKYHIIQDNSPPQFVLVTSEVLTEFPHEWHTVPQHHMLLVKEDLTTEVRPIL